MVGTVQAGTKIHGTLRNTDLIDAFSRELFRLGGFDAYDEFVHLHVPLGFSLQDAENELGSQIVSELFDALDELAPEGMYFGAIEGDGSDFGFWNIEQE